MVKKKKQIKRVLGYRGGFSTPMAFKRVPKQSLPQGWNSLLRQASKTTTDKAKSLLNEVTKNAKIRVGKVEVSMARNPNAGVTGPTKVKSPMEEISSRHAISGKNHLFTAHKHTWHVTCGKEPAAWLKRAAVDNGTDHNKFRDTLEIYDMDNANRSDLSKDFGFNQKLQWFVNPLHFGWRMDDLDSEYSFNDDYNSSKIAEQAAYMGVTKLRSVAKITNMNRYVPLKLKVSLVNIRYDLRPELVMEQSCNSDVLDQDNGAMPIAVQFTPNTAGTAFGDYVLVDPDSKGVKSANIFKDTCSIIATKSFKLAAGDHLELTYDQLCGSGLRLDKLFGMDDTTGINSATPITYTLLIEACGEQVELVNVNDPTIVMKGSCIGNIQCEFSKFIYGVNSSKDAFEVINPAVGLGSYQGWRTRRFATRVYSKSVTANFTNKKYNLSHNLVDNVNYSIPIMSDATVTTAGTNN